MAYMFSRILALKKEIPKGLNISIHLYLLILSLLFMYIKATLVMLRCIYVVI